MIALVNTLLTITVVAFFICQILLTARDKIELVRSHEKCSKLEISD